LEKGMPFVKSGEPIVFSHGCPLSSVKQNLARELGHV
jgi:hypothetical protein